LLVIPQRSEGICWFSSLIRQKLCHGSRGAHSPIARQKVAIYIWPGGPPDVWCLADPTLFQKALTIRAADENRSQRESCALVISFFASK
jgi:hypothetical protein